MAVVRIEIDIEIIFLNDRVFTLKLFVRRLSEREFYHLEGVNGLGVFGGVSRFQFHDELQYVLPIVNVNELKIVVLTFSVLLRLLGFKLRWPQLRFLLDKRLSVVQIIILYFLVHEVSKILTYLHDIIQLLRQLRNDVLLLHSHFSYDLLQFILDFN